MSELRRPATGLSGRSTQSCGAESRRSHISATFSQTSAASDVDALCVPPRNRRWKEQAYLPQAGRLAVAALPGYTGYIPSKDAENVYGLTFKAANMTALAEVDMKRTRRGQPRMTRSVGLAPGMEIAGYMGFVPGRYADNVFGLTPAKASEVSLILKAQQADERRCRVDAYRRGERPPVGTMDHTGYHSAGASHFLDTRH